MRGRKDILCVLVAIPLFLSLVMTHVNVGSASPSPGPTRIYVDPPSIVNTALTAGKYFSVSINVENVPGPPTGTGPYGLSSYQFKIRWNGPIMNYSVALNSYNGTYTPGQPATTLGSYSPSLYENNVGWTNPQDAYTSNNLYATSSANNDNVTYKNYGFTIPSGHTIYSVEVGVEAKVPLMADDDLYVSASGTGGTPGGTFTTIKSPDEFEDNNMTNPQHAFAADNVYTTNASAKGNDHVTYKTYGFSLPTEVTILKVELGLEGTNGDDQVGYSFSQDGGSTFSTETKVTLPTPEALNWYEIGPGLWTADKLTDANLRIKIKRYIVGTADWLYLDWVPVRVTWLREKKIDLTSTEKIWWVPVTGGLFETTTPWNVGNFSAANWRVKIRHGQVGGAAETISVDWVGTRVQFLPGTFVSSYYNGPDPVGDADYAAVGCSQAVVPGPWGNGTLATITFKVEAVGQSGFQLFDTVLIEAYTKDAISHTLTHGNFDNQGWAARGEPGDVNGDHEVNELDIGLMVRAMGTDPSWPPGTDWHQWNSACDLNSDSKVDIWDLVEVTLNYGQPY